MTWFASLCVDIGGTWTRAALYRGSNEDPFDQAAWGPPWKVSTQRGVAGLRAVWTALRDYYLGVEGVSWDGRSLSYQGEILQLSVGMPGQILNGILKAGTAKNLEVYEGDLDGFDVGVLFREIFGEGTVLSIENDADVQGIGAFESFRRRPGFDFLGKWAYLGLGTGLGARFSNWDGHENRLIGHSHIGDMWIQDELGKRVQAESICSGSVLQRHLGGDSLNIPLSNQALAAIHGVIDALFQVIVNIHRGSFSTGSGIWTPDDLMGIRGTELFLIGGGLMYHQVFIDLGLSRLSTKLANLGMDLDIRPIEDPDQMAVLGHLFLD